MSHFSRIKTRMVEKDLILSALTDLGYEYEEGDQKVRATGGEQVKVQIRVKAKKFGHDIGLRMVDNTWEIVADWWGVIGVRQKDFSEQLFQRYAYQAVRIKLEAQGFSLVNEAKASDGRIHLVLRRMA